MKNKLLFPIDDGDSLEAETPTKRSKKAKSKRTSSPRIDVPTDDVPTDDAPAASRSDADKAKSATAKSDQPEASLVNSDSSSTFVSNAGVPSLSADQVSSMPPIQNLLIRASAGTGKTYRLTSRYLRLLLLGASPDSILATTFTRKAAGEILDRIIQWLGEAAIEDKKLVELRAAVDLPQVTREDCRDKLLLLTRQMHRLRIYTIDAFFMQTALSFSLELGMTPGWQVLEEGGPESESLRREAIAGVLRQESLDDLLVLIHQLTPKGEHKRSLESTLQGRISAAYQLFLDSNAEAWDSLVVPPPLNDDELDELREALNQFHDDRKSIKGALENDVNRLVEENWDGFFAGRSLVKNISEGKDKYGNARIPEQLLLLYDRLLKHLRSMKIQSVRAQTLGTYRFLEKYHTQYRSLKEDQRLYSFDEVTSLLANQPHESDQFAFRMDAVIDHLLLDEFQDTSIPQWRAFTPLARHCTSGDAGRSFFCVGDVKQAIYGWRGGSSEIFDLLDRRLPNLTLSSLQDSRRSSPIIIDAVNRVFEFLPRWGKLKRARKAAVNWNFPTHTTHCRDLPGYFTIETAEENEIGKAKREEAVFRRAAERVAELKESAPGQTIGVLCRRNNKVAQMMNELLRLGIPASEEGGNYLTDSAAVELILSRLHLVDHPKDSVTAFHLASSPWASQLGLEIGECPELPLNTAADSGEEVRTWRPPGGIDPNRISKLVRDVRRELLDEGYGNTLQRWASELRPHCNRREARRLAQLVEQAYAYQHKIETPTQMGYERQRRQSIRPSEFVRHIRETKVADPSNATIRVMTVHQAKGLEFDIVVLPDMLVSLVEGHEDFVHHRKSIDDDIDTVFRYVGEKSGRELLPKKLLPMFDSLDDRSARDALCVLYVAMTRAVFALHVIVPAGTNNAEHPAGLLTEAFGVEQPSPPSSTVFELGDKDWAQNTPSDRVRTVRKEPIDMPNPQLARRTRQRNLEVVSPSEIGADRKVLMKQYASSRSGAAKTYGTVMHLWLSQIQWSDNLPDATKLRDLARGAASVSEINEWIEKFHGLLSEEPLSVIFDRDTYLHDLRKAMPGLPGDISLDVRTEQRVAGIQEDRHQVVNGMIDRLVLVRSGGQVIAAEIIDYKTSLTENSKANDQDNDLRIERYEPQMTAYKQVIKSSLRVEDVVTRLVFL